MFHIVVHPRKSNDETQMPSKLDCKGTGAITDLADNCFTVWRNKAKEEITQMKSNGVRSIQNNLQSLKSAIVFGGVTNSVMVNGREKLHYGLIDNHFNIWVNLAIKPSRLLNFPY